MNPIKPYRFYPKPSIERRANDLLERMQLTPNWEPVWPFEASQVADFLDLGIVWDRIEPDETGAIAARILPGDRQIEINEDILKLPKGFQESTIAHEIGHWMLHVNYSAVETDVEPLELGIEVDPVVQQPFVCRAHSGISELESIEWQAQYFASCLLMPRYILEQKRQERDLTRWSDLYKIRDELGVSISNLVNRLQDLGWIEIPKGSRRIYRGSGETLDKARLSG